MPDHPPAYCEHCNLLFQATAVALTNAQISLQGNFTNCPRCKRPAPILDGTYRAFAGRFERFLDPTISLAARTAILRLIADVQANKVALVDAKKEAEKIDPRLGGIFDTASWSNEARAALFGAILIAGATLVGQAINAAAIYSAPPPPVTVIVQMANPPPDLRKRLLSGTAQAPLAPPSHHWVEPPRAQNTRHRQTGTRTSVKH
jgi:hypothetical protein